MCWALHSTRQWADNNGQTATHQLYSFAKDAITTSRFLTLWLLATHPQFQVKWDRPLDDDISTDYSMCQEDAIFLGDQDRPATSLHWALLYSTLIYLSSRVEWSRVE